MNEKIDLTKILKDCPEGMELDCLMYKDVYFDYVDELNIIHCYIQHETHRTSLTFNQHGTPNSDIKSKCVIFPKGKTTWKGFQRPFIDGDIVYNRLQDTIGIVMYDKDNIPCKICDVSKNGVFWYNEGNLIAIVERDYRFATEEEKQKLFNAIKTNGYKWNHETKTLERLIVPKFKVGDTVQLKIYNHKFTITNIDNNEFYHGHGKDSRGKMCEFMIPVVKQDNWELILNKFDPKTLKPFDKVLVRDNFENTWYATFFSHIDDLKSFFYKFVTTAGKSYKYVIPYNEETEHLLGTNKQAPEFYIY